MLERLDLTQALEREEYNKQLKALQAELHELAFEVYAQKRPVVIVYEGMDASGKGGTIKRLTERIDPRGYVVWPIAAPTGEEKERHYLYRFWRRLPEQGQIAIFDRSWYGRVLVERLEGFCTEADWRRAYGEINQFERQLTEAGTIVFKFWMHISKQEQLRRFKERTRTHMRKIFYNFFLDIVAERITIVFTEIPFIYDDDDTLGTLAQQTTELLILVGDRRGGVE